MSIVTVYRFQKYDPNSDQKKVSPFMAARETIGRLGECEVIEGTGVEIDRAGLDGNGMISAAALS